MISRETSRFLNLKPYTQKGCEDLYTDLLNKYSNMSKLKNEFLNPSMDPELLNKVWWVLNYHSDTMDTNRKLRAIVESKLDVIASEKNILPEAV